MASGIFGLTQGTRETPSAFNADYDSFLDEILGKMELAHGYHVFKEKRTYRSHVIFPQDSKVENSLIKRIFNENLRGQLFSVYEIARFTEEPWFSLKFGCSPKEKKAILEIIDSEYISKHILNFHEIRNQIGDYAESIEQSQFPFIALSLKISQIPKNRILSIK